MTEAWNKKAAEHSVIAHGVKTSYVAGARHFKQKAIEMLEEKLKHFENSPNQQLRDKISVINEIINEIQILKP